MNPFSVFIPVYNEESLIVQNSEKLIKFLDGLGTDYEIILGSNGSDDQTVRLGGELQDKYKQIKFFHTHEKGPGTALRMAFDVATYDRIISADMDLSVDLNFIRRANSLLDEFDLVVGSKRMGTQERSFIRKFASASFIFCCMILLGLSFDDYSLAAKGYKKKVLKGCLDSIHGGTFYVIEVLNHAAIQGFLTAQIPASCHDERTSKFNLTHEGFYRFGRLFQLWFKQ